MRRSVGTRWMQSQARRIVEPYEAPSPTGDVARLAFDTVADLGRAATLRDLDASLAPTLRAIGFENFLAMEIKGAGIRLLAGRPHERWYSHHVANGYQISDALFATARQGPQALFFSEIHNRPDLTPLQKRIVEERRDFGLREGYANITFAPDGSIFAVAMIGADADARNPDTAAAAHILSSYYGLTARRLAAPATRADVRAPALTARQRDCLGWVREGKSATDIGDILGISAYTVHEHVAQACARLGVRTRVQAVAIALSLGLIGP